MSDSPRGTRWLVATETTPDDTGKVTVHVLRAGQPVCGFSTDFPRDWPTGHYWVSARNLGRVNCEGCLARAVGED